MKEDEGEVEEEVEGEKLEELSQLRDEGVVLRRYQALPVTEIV